MTEHTAENDAPRKRIVMHVEEPPPPPRPSGPCRATNGPHRWAYLVGGGQACGYCGRPR